MQLYTVLEKSSPKVVPTTLLLIYSFLLTVPLSRVVACMWPKMFSSCEFPCTV